MTLDLATAAPAAADAVAPRCLHERFAAHAAERPDALALVCGTESLSYGQLNRRANRLAHHLRRLGVGPGALVGIALHRSNDMIVALLAVLKAGGAYVPLDPTYPPQRLASMLGDVELSVLVTREGVLAELPAPRPRTRVVCVDRDIAAIETEPEADPPAVGPDDLCYAIFTSGSTGAAKVAGVHHGGWANLLSWFTTEFGIGAEDRVLIVSSFSFDITQRAIAMPLITGGELHLLDARVYDPGLIREVVEREEITLLNCAPSTFYPLVEGDPAEWAALRSLRVVFLGGEPISASRLQAWAQAPETATELANVYGVAECSDVSSFHRLRDVARYAETSVPAGRPIAHTRIAVMDDDLTPVAPGERGEICIAGAGVGKGYVNDRALTARKFVGGWYRTGDLGRLRDDGTLELIGRVDHQVKIRGNRIDLGDVETSLRRHPGVREAVAVAKALDGSGDARLVAYVVPRRPGRDDAGLIVSVRELLKERLPEYMVPARFGVLAELPLNPNGKVDRGVLAALDDEPVVGDVAPPAVPRTRLEAQVATTFADVLGLRAVGHDDNFFDRGGDSYLVTVLLGRLTDWSGVRLSIFDVLSGPTVAEVAAAIARGGSDDDEV